MKIQATDDFLHAGNHIATGEIIEVDERTGLLILGSGRAKRYTQSEVVQPVPSRPVIETASLKRGAQIKA